MRPLWFALRLTPLVFFCCLVTSCKSKRDIVFTNPDSGNDTTSAVVEPDKPIVTQTAKVALKGIIRDYTMTSGCEFLIEVEFMGKKSLYQPELLDEKFKDEGLEVKFTYTRSRRPITCSDAVPIILDSIE